MKTKQYTLEVGGKKMIAEFNDLADQANGSVLLRYGNTAVIATAVMGKLRDGDFFPLTVDYEERFYATGKIMGSRFMRREGRPSTEAILSGRIVDRTIRPLFNQKIRNEVQVVVTTLAIDQDDPDVVAVIAASLALGTSDIPWNGPVSAVRIGLSAEQAGKNSELLINPDFKAREEAGISMDMIACGKDGMINMIEVGSKEVSESTVNEGLALASTEIEKIQKWQGQIIAEIGKKKAEVDIPQATLGTKELFEAEITPKMEKYVVSGEPGKKKIEEINSIWMKLFTEKMPEGRTDMAQEIFEDAVNEMLHNEAIDHNRRVDGRDMDEIRPLYVKAGGVSNILHGSGIFYRGGTHVLSTLTLGSPGDALIIEGLTMDENKRFMHHYNFPPFSTGETGKMGGTNRRMIGHGALAEKALLPVIPTKDKFPYTIRLVSEAMASNGSTSMGSVCGSTLALMDGGVPISAPVAGIASGLMMRTPDEYKLLTDIQGPEDHHGDMDFKVAGTRKGITAIQMDVKVGGIPLKILAEALVKAQKARFQIIDLIEKEIPAPRAKISPTAPEIIIMKVKPDQIGLVIGSGGKTINEIKDVTHVEDITIEDDGSIFITGKDGTAEKAKDMIFSMTREYMPGEKFTGEVTRLMDFGAFVKIGPNAEGLVHVSEIAPFRVERVETYIKEGDKVPVAVKEVDDKGRINLSIKAANPDFFTKKEEKPRPPREPRRDFQKRF
jgi:polyribonucleotide nucleotidyltransferase